MNHPVGDGIKSMIILMKSIIGYNLLQLIIYHDLLVHGHNSLSVNTIILYPYSCDRCGPVCILYTKSSLSFSNVTAI